MSEIKFLKALGDEVERAAAARIAGRRGRIRRRLAIGGLGFAIAATGVAAASGVFRTPEELAANSVACFDRAAMNRNVTVLSAGNLTPIEACRRVLKTNGPLIACVDEGVHVFPGGPGTCERLGLEPLPAEYATARAKVVELGRELTALEASADCVPLDEFAARAQRLLDRLGWTGWRVDVREDLGEGPCGATMGMNGDGSRSIEPSLASGARRLFVMPGPRRSTLDLLYTPGTGANRLMDATGERCYSVEGIEQLVRDRLPAGDRAVSFTTGSRPTERGIDVDIEGARGDRLDEGCAIIVGFAPTDDDRGIVVEIWR